MFLPGNFKYLRNKFGYSQQYIADLFNYKDYTTVLKWEKGDSDPPFVVVKELSKLYGVTMEDLACSDLSKNETKEDCCDKKPIMGTIAAGNPILAHEHIVDYVYVDTKLDIDFCLIVKGNSMINKRIHDGDIVFVRRQSCVENGEIAVVMVGEEEATLKRFYNEGDRIRLKPENSDMDDLIFKGKEAEIVKVIGKVISVKFDI